MHNDRLEKLTRRLEASNCRGIVLNAGPSLSYFTGLHFHLMERPVLFIYVPGETPILVLPRLEAAKVDKALWLTTYFYDENPEKWGKVVSDALASCNGARGKLGIEPLQLRYLEYSLLQSAGDLQLIDGSDLIAAVRSRKDAGEIELMQQAVNIAEDSLRTVLPLICLRMDERELAAELVLQLFRHGSESTLPFAPIVAAGPNGANPHSQPTARKLQEGDLLIIDWGASHQGYVSDLTRTFGVGEIDEESVRIHEIVQQANKAGRDAGKENIACREVDLAARKVIDEAGYGDQFTHRTGHGIGMQCHEEPYMHKDSGQLLGIGMAYTVEPGIYLQGKNGVRIEDDVYIGENGAISLSSLPRSLVRVG